MSVNHLSEVERVELQLDAAMAARPRDNAAYVAALQDYRFRADSDRPATARHSRRDRVGIGHG